MASNHPAGPTSARIPVRTGPYQYLVVRPDGASTTIPVDRAALDAGWADVTVSPGEIVMEIALKSTSDPDTDPPRGQLWPVDAAAPLDLTTMLFVPASKPRMLEKARAIGASAVILDLEDGVGVAEKATAREALVAALGTAWSGTARLFVRVNGPTTDEFVDDLRAIAPLGVYGVCVPKCETADDVLRAETNLRLGGASDDVKLLPFVESPLGVVNAYEIASSTERVVAVALGGEDLAASMGFARTPEGGELAYFRAAVSTAAHAVGAIPIDAVYVDFHDDEGLERDARAGRALGYGGKQIVHPAQIDPVARAYAPSAEEIAAARRVVDAFDSAEARCEGVVVVDGRMIDRPVVLQARRVLSRAR